MRASARRGAALLAGCVALLVGCGEPEPEFGVEEIRAHVRSLARELGGEAESVALVRRVARDLEAIDLGELPDAVALPVPYGEFGDRRAALVGWGADSAVAGAVEAALAPLTGAEMPLRLSAEAPTGAVARLEIGRLFELHKRVRPRVAALVDAGETTAALDLVAAWVEFTRGACALGPSGAPLAGLALTRPERILSWFGLDCIAGLDESDAARLSQALRRAPSVAGWAAHNYLKDSLLLLEDAALVEADLLGLRWTFFDPGFLETLVSPLELERAEFRRRCEAAITRTALTKDALMGYGEVWDLLVRNLAAIAAIEALREAASGAEPARLELRRVVVRMEIVADLDGGVVTYESMGATQFNGEISF